MKKIIAALAAAIMISVLTTGCFGMGQKTAVATGDGVWFSMVREGTTIKLMINDTVVKTLDVSASIAADTVLNQFKLQTYNFGYGIDIPYEFYMTE